MGSSLIDDFTLAWDTDSSGLWTVNANAENGRFEYNGLSISSTAGSALDPPPHTENTFTPNLDWSSWSELRFWFKSSRSSDGSTLKPFYLVLEVDSDPPAASPWQRLIYVQKPDNWELHRLWLADMPASIRSAIHVIRLRSLNAEIDFTASICFLIVANSEPINDVEATLLLRLNNQIEIANNGGASLVPAVIYDPDATSSVTMPYIAIRPWAIQNIPAERSAGEIIDNFTIQGSYVRPHGYNVNLQYCIDVFAAQRSHKATIFEHILKDIFLNRYLNVSGELTELVFFRPEIEQASHFTEQGRTPLYCQVKTYVEFKDRIFQPWAVPFLYTGPLDGIETRELSIP